MDVSGAEGVPAQQLRMGKLDMVDYLRILLNARLSQTEDRGASAVEYGLLIAGIAALIVVIVFAFGGVIKSVFSQTCSKINASASVGSSCS